MRKNLSICIDMGAKNNGLFIVKTDGDKIVDKKATTIVFDKSSINFSKISRRQNRHRVRSYKRRKLVKRLLWEILKQDNFSTEQKEVINGLLNNRGYTFLSTSSEFEEIEDISALYLEKFIPALSGLKSKEDFEAKLSEFEEQKELEEFIATTNKVLEKEYKKKKAEFDSEFKDEYKTIQKDLKLVKELFHDILKELNTGAKHRTTYLQEIKDEIEKLDFIKKKDEFFRLIGNISNLQLRILRKFFNSNSKKDRYKLLQNYFKTFHYNYNQSEKDLKKELFATFDEFNSFKAFLKGVGPILTIPPYEDMDNRNSYKCNSMLIKDELITDGLKQSIDKLLAQKEFEILEDKSLTYSQKLQRVLDINSKIIPKEINLRNVFKHQKDSSNIAYYKDTLGENFKEFSDFAKKYYKAEEKIISGLSDETLFTKCNRNTPKKNNFKHILLKPLFECEFSLDEVDGLIQKIKLSRGLQTHLQKISETAKEFGNGFFNAIESCYNDKNCQIDKNIQNIVKNLDSDFRAFAEILKNKKSYFKDKELNKENLKRVVNIFKQTYEILFKDINGFNKTCRSCTIENNFRSSGDAAIAKRLLSDVGKPIDGMLDMLLDRLAWEVVSEVDSLDGIEKVEILLEQNRFEFEENLQAIKGKKAKKKELKDLLNLTICPYTEESFTKGEYDHILPRSKKLYNSKANLIYASVEGNKVKSNKRYYLEDLKKKHLKAIFGTEEIGKIKEIISKGLESIDVSKYTNFDNLKLKEQTAFRYALFLDEKSFEFKKAKELLKQDKLKTITNGTQKRLARFIQEKLQTKFNKDVEFSVKVIDSKEVSATRKDLAINKETGEIDSRIWKEEIQKSHSHAIDAMVMFYLVNQNFDFKDEVFLEQSSINNVSKRQTFINAKDKSSYQLFQSTIYAENYKHLDSLKDKELKILLKYSLIYYNDKNKKYYPSKLIEGKVYKIDVHKLSELLFELFDKKDEKALNELKFLDKIRYNTTKVEIESLFFDKNQTKLLEFNELQSKIPPYMEKTYNALYRKLKNREDLFKKEEDKNKLNKRVLEELLKEFFTPNHKIKKDRKRGKKRHKYTISVNGQNAQYRIRRNNIYQILGTEKITTINYFVNGRIIDIPYFSKNVLPLKIENILKCLMVDENAIKISEVHIETKGVMASYIKSLQYTVAEASRCIVETKLYKKSFIGIDFQSIQNLDGAKDCHFRKFLHYIDDRESICLTCNQAQINSDNLTISNNDKQLLKKYLGGIRNGLNGKAVLIENTQNYFVIRYRASITSDKKDLILKNLK